MSHQTKQVNTFVTLTDLTLLGRAVSSINIEALGTRLKLDLDKKEARYYGSYIDRDCFAVITYERELSPDEKSYNYEIAVKKDQREINGVLTTVYDLVADVNASDRSMRDKIAKVFEEYQLAVVTDTALGLGAHSVQEVFDDVPAGYRAIECIS